MTSSHFVRCCSWYLTLFFAAPLTARDLPTATPEDVGVSSARVAELSNYVQSLVDEGRIPGGVTLMARHGKVVHHEAVGWSDREAEKPMKPDAIFRIASMSKPVTSVAVMMLVEEGHIALDDPVAKYIPEFRNMKVLTGAEISTGQPLKTEPARRPITIRHLLTHTAGLYYEFTPKVGQLYAEGDIASGICRTDMTLEENVRRLAAVPLMFHPGEDFAYSMAIDVLGRVVEVASGMPFERFITEKLCRPLGMNDTFFHVPLDKRPRLVAAYSTVDTCLRRIRKGELLQHGMDDASLMISADYPVRSTHVYASGGAGLCSTATDYLRFCQMLLNGGQLDGHRILREETVRLMTTDQAGRITGKPVNFGFGFGMMTEGPDTHELLVDSYAWSGFWNTHFRIAPRGEFIVIVMMQLAWNPDQTPDWQSRVVNMAASAIED